MRTKFRVSFGEAEPRWRFLGQSRENKTENKEMKIIWLFLLIFLCFAFADEKKFFNPRIIGYGISEWQGNCPNVPGIDFSLVKSILLASLPLLSRWPFGLCQCSFRDLVIPSISGRTCRKIPKETSKNLIENIQWNNNNNKKKIT